MKRGDIVMVYQDPVTEKKPEGEATLVRRVGRELDGSVVFLERWVVRFADEDETVSERFIRPAGGKP